jgi:hypothetical protein
MSFTFGSTFKYDQLRKLWISNQLNQLTELLFFIDLSILEIGNNAMIIYNGATDYNDDNYESYLSQITNRIIQFDSQKVIVWRQNTSSVNKYEVVETQFNSFVNSINKSISDYNDTDALFPDFIILRQFANQMSTFYNNSTSLLMSIEDLRVHLNIYKLISNSISNISSKVKAIRQYIYVVGQNDANHILYKSLEVLDTQLGSLYTNMLEVTDYLEKIMIFNLQNNISNTTDNFTSLSSKIATVQTSLENTHLSLLHIFINDATSNNYAITSELV